MKYVNLPLINKFKHYGYNSQAHIGKGSYGCAYLGKDLNKKDGENIVAIKKINMELLQEEDEYLSQCIKKEIDIQKKLTHENVLSILDTHKEGKYIYMVLPYCDGGDLGKELLQKQRIPEEHAIKILKHMMLGLQHLNENSVTHRDLKPDNIFIRGDKYMIADFGFARLFHENELMDSMVGTPLYESPQILQNDPYTQKSDIWSLGMVYYEMIFGTVPWDCSSIDELIMMIKKQPVRFNASVPLSNNSKNFILSCLCASEAKRIGWKDLFKHPIFEENKGDNTQFLDNLEQKVKNNIIKIQKEYVKRGIDVKEIFKTLDNDHDTTSLNFSEFQAFLKEFEQNLSYKEQKIIFDQFDKDKSGQISFDEFSQEIFGTTFENLGENKVLSKMRSEKIIKQLKGFIENSQTDLKHLFEQYDTNHSETLNLEEFKTMIQQINNQITEYEVAQLFRFFDQDQNQTISLQEFAESIHVDLHEGEVNISNISPELENAIQNMKRFMKVHDLSLNQIFEMFDDNSSDNLDLQEFQAILNCISSRFKPEIAKQLFEVFDISKDGNVSKEEFAKIIN